VDLPQRFTLVIAEKPRAAEKIAHAIAARGFCRRIRISGVPIWIVCKSSVSSLSPPVVVASAAGHLFSLYTDERGYPVFSCRWVPRYIAEPSARHTRRFLSVLKRICPRALLYVNACDYDIEGSLIGYLIIKFLGDERRAKRAKFSSLTATEIRSSFAKLEPLDREMAEAGECRHILDWLWGINVSRALMDVFRSSFRKRQVLSAGRVQSPTLIHAVEIDLERKLFIPIPKLYPYVRVRIGTSLYTLELDDEPFSSKREAIEFAKKAREQGYAHVINVDSKVERISPPPPFNLPDLQAEASRLLKLSPYTTQKIAEDLYLDALISYPRTNSQRLPPTLDNKSIVAKLSRYSPISSLARKLLAETRGVLKPHNGPKTDPAHPAIYPTGEIPTKPLPRNHSRLFELIIRRYLATFSSDAIIKLVTARIEVAGKRFKLSGVRIVRKGWYEYYPYHCPQEKIIPALKPGDKLSIATVSIRVRYTKPPHRITRLGLVKWMEEQDIGTESTRAEIVETLYRRGYIVSRRGCAEVTDLGIAVAMVLKKFVPDLTSVELTRRFERMLRAIQSRQTRCSKIVEEAKNILTRYLAQFLKNGDSVAREFRMYLELNDNEPTCSICKRLVYRDSLCIFHYEASRRLNEAYKLWFEAGFSFDQYIQKLLKLSSTGRFVKEVAVYIARKGKRSLLSDAGR